jgi:acyl-CoA synthetase (AMP-forming)/AMP-acid ligase II
MNPAEWLRRSARLYPDRPALLQGARVVADYATFHARAAAIGGALAARHGVGPGHRVAIFMKNRTEYLEAMYGVWMTGAAAIPINAKLHPKEAAWIIENAEAEIALISDGVGGALADIGPACLKVLVSSDSADWSAMYAAEPLAAPAPFAPEDLLWLFYTSGTTGKPKGVKVLARNVMHMTMNYFSDVDEVSPDDAILYAAPMSHGAGIYNFIHVLKAARHVVPDSGGFDPAEIFALAKSVRNISMFAAPTMVKRLVDHAKATGEDGDGIKTISYAGGPMYLADIIEAVEVLGDRFVQVYGQGECPMGITALPRHFVSDRTHPRWKARLGSVGTAQSAVEVAIFDEEGRALPPGEIGEIVVNGQTVMGGYWQNDEATAKTIRDGWLWTGDMGAMDDDGFVTMHDRSKDMIISGGSNVYPREVEEVLLEHPSVSEVAVVGRKHPEWGEIVVAFVVPAKDHPLDPAALDAHCVENIARFKKPKEYRQIAELPKNNYGKVLKTDLRDILAKE